jgi:hypothetical protein
VPTLYADAGRVVVYTNGDTSPETASPPDLSRVKFDTDLEYVRTIRENTVTLNLPALNRQASGSEDPAYFQNHVLETHGLGYTPLVFGYAIISGGQVPLRGSVPIQISASLANFFRCISLGASATQVLLNEYAVRNYFASASNSYAAIDVTVTYFVTDVNLDD